MVKFSELDPEDFPMLCAMRELILSLGCSAQSAPSSEAEYLEVHWAILEKELGQMKAKDFVTFVFGSPDIFVSPELSVFSESFA